MKKALAIDIGGTKIYNAIVNNKGQIISEVVKQPTPKTLDEIQLVLRKIIADHENDVDVIAIATAGVVNKENTAVIGSTGNIADGYACMNFQALSSKKVFVENDANAASWAEHLIGVSKGCSDSILLTLGTGVGGGIIVNNRILKGKNGGAGEMHFKLSTEKRRRCTCGAFDCFEAYASGTGLQITAREETKIPSVTTYDVIDEVREVLKLTQMLENKKTVIERLRLCVEDNYVDAFLRWQDDILAGCVGLANIFDPEMIVLSGSMAEFVDLEYIETEVNSQIVATPIKVRRATAGNYAGMIGAAFLALGVNEVVA